MNWSVWVQDVLNGLIVAIERIAGALERIAESLERQE